MPRNFAGNYTLPAGNPVVAGTTIDASWANDTMSDLANEITNSLSRNGEGGMLAAFRVADGTVSAPGLAFTNETNSGIYRAGTGELWLAVGGVAVAQITGNGLLIPSGKRIALPAPVNDTDAANKVYVDDLVDPVIGYADFYLGPKSSDPTLNNSGGALTAGTTYWSTTLSQMRVYNGTTWEPMPSTASLQGQTFSGTGAQTAFTLAAPTGNATNLEVFISGVRQVPTNDYTVSGTTLTFVAAPPSGTNNIYVRFAQLIALASADSSNVSFLQSGTGAVARTVQSKLRDTVSVLDFGADPTGVADSASAILSACLTGKKVLFPQGTYLVGSTIALTSSHAGCGFVLDGATIKKGFNGTLVTITGCADFTVDGTGKFEGQSATYSGKGFVFSGIGSIRPEFGPGIFINDFAAAHIEIGADAAMYLKTYARIITGSSDLAIDITGTDTSARQRSIYGEIIGYVRLAGTISTFIKPTIVNRIEIASTCSVTVCSGFSWSNNGLAMTIDGANTIITGCRFAGAVTLNSTMTGVFVGNYQTQGTFTNNTIEGSCTVIHLSGMEARRGTTSLPSYSFTGNNNSGVWQRTTNVVDVATGGTTCVEFQNNRMIAGSDTAVAWGDAATVPSITTFDTSLFRPSAGVLVAGLGGVLTGSIGAICGKLFPRTDAGAQQTAAGLLGGTGAPNNANGNNGDFYFRSDGGASTTIYHKRAGSWVGVV